MLNYDMTGNLRALIIILIWMPSISLGQSKFSLDIFGTPFIQKFGKTTDTDSYLEHPNITAEYIYHPAQEAGIIFNQTFENKFGWSAGVSWGNDHRSLRLTCFEDSLKIVTYPLISISKDIKIQRLAFKAGCGYAFSDKIQLDFFISTFFRIKTETTPEWNFNFYQYHYAAQTNLHVQVYEKNTINETQIIPEVRFSAEILKGLRIHAGTRLKFWGPYYLFTWIEGSFETVAYSDEVIHRSFMSGGDLSYFAGLTYRFGLQKKLSITR